MKEDKQTLGVCMIVKNESEVLEKCLESVKDVDEIVILDTGSTDNTCEIARKYTDKVYENTYKWEDHFAKARNKALEYATCDWVLSIDADEVLEKQGVPKIRDAIERGFKVINIVMYSGTHTFWFPRLFKRDPAIFWKGAVHNYLNTTPDGQAPIRIRFGYSPAHKKDPDRALRILKREVEQGKGPREIFYLAREYMYKKEYQLAIKWYDEYLKKAHWAPEMSEANYQKAKAYWNLDNLLEAQKNALEAIRINANFREAIDFLSTITGPKNSARWAQFASTANNTDVLFVRAQEKGAPYYDNVYSKSQDMSRYLNIYKKVGEWSTGKALDMGCGLAILNNYVDDYHGFDFSDFAVKEADIPNVWKGDIYKEPLEGYDTYILLEVLEHVKDKEVLERIPAGKRIIFSVPSFPDPSHLRTYREHQVDDYFKDMVDIKQKLRFNWNKKWDSDYKETHNYIILVEGIKT